eukprot:828352_1
MTCIYSVVYIRKFAVLHDCFEHFTTVSQFLTGSRNLRFSSPNLCRNFCAVKRCNDGMIPVQQLQELVEDKRVDTVLVGFTDIYGRFMGKRFDAEFFLEDCVTNGTHACDYLLACDIEQNPINGFKFANWEEGFGDFHLVPDMSSLRLASWLPKTAMVCCDVHNNETHKLVDIAPRSMLRRQVEAAKNDGFTALAATELEYYTYKDTFDEAAKKGYQNLEDVSNFMEDYHLLQGTKEESFHGLARKHLKLSGIPVENSKGEAGIGQHELNVKYSDILGMADRHITYKQCLKEIAHSIGCSVTFMAKPFT